MGPTGKPVGPINHTHLRQGFGGSSAGERNPPKHGRTVGVSFPVQSYAFLHGQGRGLLRRRMNFYKKKIMIRVPTHREPTHPGEMLLEEFLNPMEITQRELAMAIHVPYQRVNELVNKRRGVTPSTALRLATVFGTSPDFWMNLQLRWDLYRARESEGKYLRSIKNIKAAHIRV